MSDTLYRVVRDTRNPRGEFTLEDGTRPENLVVGMLVQHAPLTEPDDEPPAAERLAKCVFDKLAKSDSALAFLENVEPHPTPIKRVRLSPGSWSTPT